MPHWWLPFAPQLGEDVGGENARTGLKHEAIPRNTLATMKMDRLHVEASHYLFGKEDIR